MATVTKTIGATGRDYSTIVLWEADLDDADDYNADDDAVGECYDDADFDMNGDFTLDGGDLDDGSGDLATVRLTVAEGHRHDGTAGTGVRVYTSTTAYWRWYPIALHAIASADGPYDLIIEWIDFDGSNEGSGKQMFSFNSQTAGSHAVCCLRNCLIHNHETRWVNATTYDVALLNNIFYACGINKNSSETIAIYKRGYRHAAYTYNNTFHYVRSGSTAGHAKIHGYRHIHNYSETRIKNNLSTGHELPNSSSTAIYGYYAIASKTPFSNTTRYSHNAGDDSSVIDIMLEGTVGSSLCFSGVVPSDIYVSSTYGSEDLKLKENTGSGPNVIGSGTDLGNDKNINYDITGYDRDDATTWDIGADQFVADDTVGASFAMFVD